MTLTVGTDTYISLADALTYLESVYISTDAQLVAWKAISTDGDREIHLRNACYVIERIKFPGVKYDPDQALAFPRDRILPFPARRDPIFEEVKEVEGVVPDSVKYAQVEEALEMASPSGDTTQFEALTGHVQSYGIGKFRETLRSRSGSGSPNTMLRSKKAQEYLSLSAGGSFRVV